MTIAMIFFFVALIGIVGMIWLKAFELKSNKKFFLARSVEKIDPKIEYVYTKSKTFISYFNRKSAVALIQWIAYHILSWGRSVYIWLHRKAHAHPPSKKVIDMVRGKGEIEKIGGASFYLKMISKDRTTSPAK